MLKGTNEVLTVSHGTAHAATHAALLRVVVAVSVGRGAEHGSVRNPGVGLGRFLISGTYRVLTGVLPGPRGRYIGRSDV